MASEFMPRRLPPGLEIFTELALDPVGACHLNEGHAELVIVERARSAMKSLGLSFSAALWATRAGTVFTSHTPVAAGFDAFAPEPVQEMRVALAERRMSSLTRRLVGRVDAGVGVAQVFAS